MTNYEPGNAPNDDGFVSAAQPLSESYAPVDPSFQSPPAYSNPPLQPAKKKTNVWLIVGIVALLLLCCCCAMAVLGYVLFGQDYRLNDFTLILPALNII